MASPSKLTIRVTLNKTSSTISYSTTGIYGRLTTGNVKDTINLAALQPTTGSKAFWESVMAAVIADITAGNGGGS
jgi:hypothetical protein